MSDTVANKIKSVIPQGRDSCRISVVAAFAISFLIGLSVCMFFRLRSESELKHARGLTARNLARAGRLFDSWFEAYGRYPAPERWLDEAKRELGKDYRKEDFLDGWDNQLRFKLVKQRGIELYLLYSTGPDGIDFQGRGDDMVLPIGGYSDN